MIPSIIKTKVVEAWRQCNSEAVLPSMPAMAHSKNPMHTPSQAQSLTSCTSVASPPITYSTIPSRHASPIWFVSPSHHTHGASQPKSAPQAHKSKFTPPLSEVSCENCTHMAIVAKKKVCYTQRDSGGVWTTPEMSGQGLHWDTKGMYEDENTAII